MCQKKGYIIFFIVHTDNLCLTKSKISQKVLVQKVLLGFQFIWSQNKTTKIFEINIFNSI